MNEKLLLFLTLPPGFALVGALIAAPNLVHVLDEGGVTTTITELAQGKLASRNVNVSAQVVMLSYANEVTDAAERPGKPMELEGTVRDALWEGPPSEVREALEAIHPLAPEAKVLELRGPRSTSDRLWAYGAPLAGLLLGLLSASGAHARKNSPEAAG